MVYTKENLKALAAKKRSRLNSAGIPGETNPEPQWDDFRQTNPVPKILNQYSDEGSKKRFLRENFDRKGELSPEEKQGEELLTNPNKYSAEMFKTNPYIKSFFEDYYRRTIQTQPNVPRNIGKEILNTALNARGNFLTAGDFWGLGMKRESGEIRDAKGNSSFFLGNNPEDLADNTGGSVSYEGIDPSTNPFHLHFHPLSPIARSTERVWSTLPSGFYNQEMDGDIWNLEWRGMEALPPYKKYQEPDPTPFIESYLDPDTTDFQTDYFLGETDKFNNFILNEAGDLTRYNGIATEPDIFKDYINPDKVMGRDKTGEAPPFDPYTSEEYSRDWNNLTKNFPRRLDGTGEGVSSKIHYDSPHLGTIEKSDLNGFVNYAQKATGVSGLAPDIFLYNDSEDIQKLIDVIQGE